MSYRAVEIIDRELEENPVALDERKHQTSVAFGVLEKAGFTKKDASIHFHKHEHHETKELSDEELFRDVIDIVGEEVEDA